MTQTYLAACVDDKGHSFRDSRPPAGDYGTLIIYCTRCGGTRAQLIRRNLGVRMSNG